MITLNGRPCSIDPGWTIQSLLDFKRFTYPKIIVTHNGIHIESDAYAQIILRPGDEVNAIHMMAGG